MFGSLCCTFIPNNTAPDGSVTKAMDGLRAVADQMAGVDSSLEAWFSSAFRKYKALMMSILVSIACFVAILVCCGCCFIPCARSAT